jgi:hypothetical protein
MCVSVDSVEVDGALILHTQGTRVLCECQTDSGNSHQVRKVVMSSTTINKPPSSLRQKERFDLGCRLHIHVQDLRYGRCHAGCVACPPTAARLLKGNEDYYLPVSVRSLEATYFTLFGGFEVCDVPLGFRMASEYCS